MSTSTANLGWFISKVSLHGTDGENLGRSCLSVESPHRSSAGLGVLGQNAVDGVVVFTACENVAGLTVVSAKVTNSQKMIRKRRAIAYSAIAVLRVLYVSRRVDRRGVSQLLGFTERVEK
jgi:hypothetical protein